MFSDVISKRRLILRWDLLQTRNAVKSSSLEIFLFDKNILKKFNLRFNWKGFQERWLSSF